MDVNPWDCRSESVLNLTSFLHDLVYIWQPSQTHLQIISDHCPPFIYCWSLPLVEIMQGYIWFLSHNISLFLSVCLDAFSFSAMISLSQSLSLLPPPSPICLFTAFSNVAWVHSSKSVTLTKRPLTISNVTPKYLQSCSKRQILWWRSENQVEMRQRYWLKGTFKGALSSQKDCFKKKNPQCSGGK